MLDVEATGKRIRLARQMRRMNQTELADRIGYSGKAVSAWERGVNAPTGNAILELCRALNVSADWLLGTKGEEK